MQKPRPLFIAYNKIKKGFFNPRMKDCEQITYDNPKYFQNLTPIVSRLRKLTESGSLRDWDFYQVKIDLEKLEIEDFID